MEHWVYTATIFGHGVSFNMDTLIMMWFSMFLLIVFALITTRHLDMVPGKLQLFGENVVKYFNNIAKSSMGNDEAQKHIAIILTLFMFILTANLVGQLPLKLIHLSTGELASPTNDINVTAALAVIVLIYYIVSGVRLKGIGYFKHYFQPVWFMTPFNMLEDIVRPLTLALRLFANILAGEILIMVLGGLIASLLSPEAVNSFCQNTLGGILPSSWVYNIGLFLGSLLPLPIMFFELFVAFIQALVFTLLTSAYIQGAVSKH